MLSSFRFTSSGGSPGVLRGDPRIAPTGRSPERCDVNSPWNSHGWHDPHGGPWNPQTRWCHALPSELLPGVVPGLRGRFDVEGVSDR